MAAPVVDTFAETLQKVKKKEVVEDMRCYEIAGKTDDASLAKFKEMTQDFYDYAKFFYEKGATAPTIVTYLGIAIGNTYKGDESIAVVPKAIDLLKMIAANTALYDKDETWRNSLGQLLGPVIYTSMDKLTKYHRDLAPIFVGLMKSKHLGMNMGGYINQMQMSNTRLFVPFIEQIIDNLEFNPTAGYLLSSLQQAKPEIFHKKIDKIWQYFLDWEPSSKSSVITCIWNISKEKPDVVAKYAATPDFKDALFSQMTAAMACYTVKEVAAVQPGLFVDWVDDLVDAMKTMTAGYTLVPMALANVARADEETCAKILKIFLDTMNERKSDATTVMMMMNGIKGMQDKYRNVVGKQIEAIRSFHDHPDTNVRAQVDHIISVHEGRDLKSVNTKVDKNTTDIKEVKSDVKEQGQKLEQVDKKVNDTVVRVDKVETDVKQTKEEVKATTQKVDKLEVKVDDQGKQIQKILDHFDELNARVKDACKNYDDIKAYVDKNVDTLKEFISDVVKKLPTPVKFTATGKIRRTLTLYFQCGHQYQDCLYPKSDPYTTETSDWAKWLKVSMSLVKLGKALYDKEIFDVVEHVQNIYKDFATKEDQDFVAYISQPFLTSVEQDNLINQLRDQRFFEFFAYSSSTGEWVCNRCSKKEKDGKNPQAPGTPTTPTTPKPSKVNSFLNVNLGMFGKYKKFWCIYEADKVAICKTDTDKDKAKPKLVIAVREIAKFTELDPRVEKKENAFMLTTKAKTYKFFADSKEVLVTWRDVLKM